MSTRAAQVPTCEFVLVPLGTDPELIRTRINQLGASGFSIAATLPTAINNPPTLLFARPTGVTLIEVNVPDESAVVPVGLSSVPRQPNGAPRGFRK